MPRFAGTGLGIAAAAMVNIVALRAGDRSSPTILFATNSVMVGFFARAFSIQSASYPAAAK